MPGKCHEDWCKLKKSFKRHHLLTPRYPRWNCCSLFFHATSVIISWARSFNTGTSLDYFSKLRVKSLNHNTTDKHFVSAVALIHRYITKSYESTINPSEKTWQWRAYNECCTVLLGVSIKDACLYEKQGSTASLSLSVNSVSPLSSPCSASPSLPFHHYSHSVLLFLSL